MYQVILFDLDDTLVDFTRSETIGLKNIFEAFYKEVAYAEFERVYREINVALWKQVGAKENSLTPNDVRLLRFSQLNQLFFCSVSAEEVATLYDLNLSTHAHWLPDVKTAIEFLHRKGHILGIITNGLVDAQRQKQQRLGLDKWFDCYIVSDEVGMAKPNTEIFDLAIKEIARKRNQPIDSYGKSTMLMVGDSMMSDGRGAMNFGIDYCLISINPPNIGSSVPPITYHLNSVAHLPVCIGYEAEYSHFLQSRISEIV